MKKAGTKKWPPYLSHRGINEGIGNSEDTAACTKKKEKKEVVSGV